MKKINFNEINTLIFAWKRLPGLCRKTKFDKNDARRHESIESI